MLRLFRNLACLATLVLSALPSRGSDGEISILATIPGTSSPTLRGAECDHWFIKWNVAAANATTPYGSCLAPTLKVYAELQGASADGITGLEYSIRTGPDRNPDPGYVLFEVPEPGPIVMLGSPLLPPDPDVRGTNWSWADCQQGVDGRILLETVLVIPILPCGPSQRPPQLDMTVAQHSTPSNRYFRCPLFTLCDGPVYTKVCLGDNIVPCQTQAPPFPNDSQCSTSGEFVINGPGRLGTCRTAKASPTLLPGAVSTRTWSDVKALFR